jgi:hypothetical protein
VKQQIGLVLSRLYSSLSDAFTTITQGDKKLLFQSFEKWIKNNHVLSGFMINEEILKTIFSHLDAQKKGYLLEKDFIGLFGSYNYKAEQTKEFLDFITIKFSSCEEFYKQMAHYSLSTPITFSRFVDFLNESFGSRFK